MARFAAPLLSLFALFPLISTPLLIADPPASDPIANTLALQQAMQKARYCLQHGNDSQKAVELLEAQLPKVSGNTEYLNLLREAYRANIQRLYLVNEPARAQTYMERLCVLEPKAAADPALRPAPDVPLKVVPATAKAPEKKPASNFPDFGKLALFKSKPPIARGVPEDTIIVDDPFDAKNQRELSPASDRLMAARQLLAKGDAEFKQARYAQARSFYEQAHQLEADSLAKSKSREAWAYCIFNDVVERLNQPAVPSQALPDLRKQVQTAIAMAPEQGNTGQWLLAQIDERQRTASAAPANVAPIGLKHLGRNPEGWQVSETANFRIFHKQNNDFAERVAQVAERTRSEMSRKWFGNESTAWQPKCELIIHPSGKDYAQMTGVSMSSPGHSRIESDKTNAARIVARRMDMRLDTPGMMDGVLPHETTHCVLAGQFGPFPVPRWADEGIAVLTEPAAKIEQHRQNLLRAHQDGLLFGLKELMTMPEYPEPRRIGAFYAQSVMLCEFLTNQKNPTVLTNFVRDGLREGYESALQKHYGMNFAQLQQAWNQQILGSQKVASGN